MLGAAFGLCAEAHADDDSGKQRHFELWSGAQAYRNVWSTYAGLAVAPFGPMDQDGWRLRLAGGYGGDHYSGSSGTKFEAATSFADALVGYHSQFGPLTVKVFAGLAAADRRIEPDEPAARVRGTHLGGKAAIETWLNLGDQVWTAVDLSWASIHQDYAGRARFGWRFSPGLSAGIEAGAVGNFDSDIVRAATFLRYELTSGEVSLTGGVSSDTLRDGKRGLDAASVSPFAMLSWLHRF
jgi:hypothetical protein